MSIWGTILGGAAGMALGGPIGAMLGAAAMHFAGRATKGKIDNFTAQATFTVGFIALCAKMAKADGVGTRDEINVFKKVFQIPANEMKNVSYFFNLAKKKWQGLKDMQNNFTAYFIINPLC